MKQLLTILCLTMAWCGQVIAQNPLIETVRSRTQAQTFLQNNINYTTVCVSEYVGKEIEICGQVLIDNRNEKNRATTIQFAQDGYLRRQEKSTAVSSKIANARPIGYLDIDQVDSLIIMLNDIRRRSFGIHAFEAHYTMKGGLTISYFSRLKELHIYSFYYKEQLPNSYYYNYNVSEDDGVYAHLRTGNVVAIKTDNELFDIIQALKQAKLRVENYVF